MSSAAATPSAELKTSPIEQSELELTLQTKIERQRAAAESGDVNEQYKLALLLKDGTDEQKKEAFALFCKLADAGHLYSKNSVGVCYDQGCGVQQDRKKAFECYREAAELGHVQALFNLGLCFRFGDGTEKDEKKAVDCYRKAAEKGHANAQHNLACCFRDGIGVERDAALAFELLNKAAAQQYAPAQNTLARAYETGVGCNKDLKQAFIFYQMAAEQGQENAQFNLALCYKTGSGVSKSDQLAFGWFQKAAQAGHAQAQLQLARCFTKGRGVEQDIGQALEWLAKAEAGGEKAAVVERMYLQADAASQALFQRWKAFDSPARRPKTIPKTNLKPPFRLLQTSTFGQAVQCVLSLNEGVVDAVVKVPKDERISEAWLNEMLALTAVPRHENVLKLRGICSEFECTDAKGVKLKPPLSFVTEFAVQGSIADYFSRKENEGNSAKFLLPWALNIARGLAHLHKHGCVHRDLAARNVFISKHNRAIIGDLGLARPLDEAKGVFKSEQKSAAYPIEAAPQVLQAEEYSPASDVFSFGLTLFEIATECKFDDAFAFSRSSLSAQAAKIEQLAAKGYPELVSKLPATVPASMVELMLRCLAFEAEKRPTAEQLVTELEIERQRATAESSDANDQHDLALLLAEKGTDEQKKEAFALFCKLADAGHLDSKTMVGWCYDMGCGVQQDAKKAFECYREAAELGHLHSLFNLGVCCHVGRGTEKDDNKAVECWRKAADKGHARAQYNLACCLRDGVGVERDEKQAFELFVKAAAQNDANAIIALAAIRSQTQSAAVHAGASRVDAVAVR